MRNMKLNLEEVMRMKSSNEFTPKEMKKLLERMIRIKDILTSNGYYVPETGNMKCPFHINEHTPAAKYYPDSNCIYCFTEHKIYHRVSDFRAVRLFLHFHRHIQAASGSHGGRKGQFLLSGRAVSG